MPRVVVDGGTLADDRIHVGDRDQDLDGAAGQALGDGELIEVPRVVVVDRAPEKIAQVAPPLVLERAGPGIRSSSSSTRGENSGSSPRSTIARRAIS